MNVYHLLFMKSRGAIGNASSSGSDFKIIQYFSTNQESTRYKPEISNSAVCAVKCVEKDYSLVTVVSPCSISQTFHSRRIP